MSVFTISVDLVKNCQEQFIVSVLYPLINPLSGHRMAVDKKKLILDRYYTSVASTRMAAVAEWIRLISICGCKLEIINVTIEDITDNFEACMTICTSTNGEKNMVVNSIQDFPYEIDDSTCNFNGKHVHVYDALSAEAYINSKQMISISNSQVAGGNIIASKNINN